VRPARRAPAPLAARRRRAATALALAGLLVCSGAAAMRVVTLAPNLAELACAAGACDQLVAVSAYSNYPASVAGLPKIGDGFSINYELLLTLHPDLVLAWGGGTPPATISRLRGLGLKVEPITARRLSDVAAALLRIGRLLGTRAVAERAAADYRQRLAALRARWRNARPVRVVYQLGTQPAYSINADSPISDALQLCGGINVFAGMAQLSAPIGKESMIAARPEVALYSAGDENAIAMQAYWASLPGTIVARLGTLYGVDGDWLGRATPRLLDGVEQVCTVLDRARTVLDGAGHGGEEAR
jgi:ABC-type Fe3+-hydroxamate transport system substrate-binding protein